MRKGDSLPSIFLRLRSRTQGIFGFVDDAVAVVATSELTPPTDCGEIFRGVDFGGATGCDDTDPETHYLLHRRDGRMPLLSRRQRLLLSGVRIRSEL